MNEFYPINEEKNLPNSKIGFRGYLNQQAERFRNLLFSREQFNFNNHVEIQKNEAPKIGQVDQREGNLSNKIMLSSFRRDEKTINEILENITEWFDKNALNARANKEIEKKIIIEEVDKIKAEIDREKVGREREEKFDSITQGLNIELGKKNTESQGQISNSKNKKRNKFSFRRIFKLFFSSSKKNGENLEKTNSLFLNSREIESKNISQVNKIISTESPLTANQQFEEIRERELKLTANKLTWKEKNPGYKPDLKGILSTRV